MTPQEARSLFACQLAERAENRSEAQRQLDSLNQRLLSAYEVAATVKRQAEGKERGKSPYSSILTQGEIDTVKSRYASEYQQIVSYSNARLFEIDKTLRLLSEIAEILPGDPKTILSFTTYDFSNQPDAAHYARAVAASFTQCYIRFGKLDARLIHPSEDQWDVQVHVATELDLEILRRRGEGPVKEVVRILLKHQINPQVVNPGFPYPEALGLDWNGNDIGPTPRWN